MRSQSLLELAIRLHNQGDYPGARAQCERALALSEAPENLASDLWDVLGSSQRDEGDLESARVSYGRALQIRQRLYGTNSAEVATTLSNLGVVEQRAGRHSEAIPLLSHAVLILSEKHGDHHSEVARSSVNLGAAHAAAGNLDTARAILLHAAAALETTFGETHPDFGRAVGGLAKVYFLGGDVATARALFGQAVGILSTTLGPDHPQTVSCRADLIRAAGRSEASSAEATFARGAELKMAGDVEGARRELMVCLSTGDPEWAPCAAFEMGALLTKTKDVAGACDAYRLAIRLGHTNIAPKAAMNLGILLAEQGNTAGAGEAYRLAIASGHPDEAPRAAVNLGFLLLDTDRPAAVDAFELAIRSAHTEQAPIARINLAVLLLKSGDEKTAREHLRAGAASGHPTWAARAEAMLGELDKEYTLAGELEEAGAELTVRGRYEEAIPVLEGALTVSRKLADRNHGPVELILVAPFNNHGFCLLKLRRLPEALRSFQEAIAIADRHPGEASDDVVGPAFAAALMSAASILGELGQADRAMEITDRLVVLRRALPAPENLPADPELAKGLRMFALVRGATGLELERALSVAREATSLYEQLARHAPDDFGRELEVAYATLGGLLERLGHDEEACRLRDSTGVTRVPWHRR